MEEYRKNLLEAAYKFCEATGKALSTAGLLAANDGKFFPSLEDGAGCTIDRYLHVIDWLKKNTPKKKTTNNKLNSLNSVSP